MYTFFGVLLYVLRMHSILLAVVAKTLYKVVKLKQMLHRMNTKNPEYRVSCSFMRLTVSQLIDFVPVTYPFFTNPHW